MGFDNDDVRPAAMYCDFETFTRASWKPSTESFFKQWPRKK